MVQAVLAQQSCGIGVLGSSRLELAIQLGGVTIANSQQKLVKNDSFTRRSIRE